MDRMRSRKPTFKGQPSLVSRATHEDFKPTIEWIDDQSQRTLLMQLPGFKREEIRVVLDKAGKLLIKGSKQVSENSYLDVDQIFDVPEDTIADKISGRFEDGRLTLVMPKTAVKIFVGEKKEEAKDEGHIEEKTPSHEEKKDEHIKEERSKDTGEKQNELTQEEKAKSIEEEKKEAAAKYEHPEEKSIEEEKKEAAAKYEHPEEKTTSKEAAAKYEHPEEKTTRREEKEENGKEEKPKDTEEKQNELTRKETRKSKDEPVKEEESKNIEEKTTRMKKKLREMRMRIPNSWLSSGTLDKLNRNKQVIAVAVVSFSAGVYACRKLSTCGG